MLKSLTTIMVINQEKFILVSLGFDLGKYSQVLLGVD